MKILYLDFETSDTKLYTSEGKLRARSPAPFLNTNFLVSFGYRTYGYPIGDGSGYHFFRHKEFNGASKPTFDILQALLDQCDLLVAYNAKFELQWLLEAGFKYEGPVRCSYVTEYILSRGVRRALGLRDLCLRYRTSTQKSDITDAYWEAGLGYHEMPISDVEEYGKRDVDALYEVDQAQQLELQRDENKPLHATIQMSMEFLVCLVEMERNGLCIDLEALEDIRREYQLEYDKLKKDLEDIARSVLGDTPFNLDSPQQLSEIIYSRKVNDKKQWAEIFNLGTNDKGKKLPKTRMSAGAFTDAVRRNTTVLKRTEAVHCTTCGGRGVRHKIKADGGLFKKATKCGDCGGRGFLLHDTGKVAGLKVRPGGSQEASSGGFETGKKQIVQLLGRVQSGSDAQTFLSCLVRYNAVGTYLETFVEGISRGTVRGVHNLLHTKLNQAITATGRLSSTDPNFQNMPRGNTFPVRRAVISRWAGTGGEVLEVDFAQLEFRVAVYLADDVQGRTDIEAKVDVHTNTAGIIKCSRQDAKPHTFKPLYGGSSGTTGQQAYYKWFKERYHGVTEWQERNINDVLKCGRLTLPSGRQYDFPGTRRTRSGYVVNTTAICNYPVQGFATADLVPVTIIEILNELRKRKLLSILCLTVHDSIVFDVYPGERAVILALIDDVFGRIPAVLRRRYDITLDVEMGWEVKGGLNWLQMKELHKGGLV